MSTLFDADGFVRAMVGVEAALARVCGDLDLISRSAADEIAERCSSVEIDSHELLRQGWESGTPVVPLLRHLRLGLSDAAATALHLGATTQDIVDTARMCQVTQGLRIIENDLSAVVRRLAELSKTHRATPMVARTFLQHAGATTFGLRSAQWLVPLGAALPEIRKAASQCAVQLGGPVGVLDGFGEHGLDVMEGLASALALAPAVPWHGDRSNILRVAQVLQRVTRSAAKTATDVALLCSEGISEVRVRSGGSSSIPNKHNPIDAVRVIAAAAACSGAIHTLVAAPAIELERGVGGWHAEWFALPVAFMSAGATIEALRRCIESLTIDEAAMSRNLTRAGTDASAAILAAGRLLDRILAEQRIEGS